MFKYVLKRLGLSVIVLLGVSIIIYFLVRLMPTDYLENKFSAQIQQGTITIEQLDDFKKRYGLYMKSWNTFLENPFLGGEEVGGHSMLLDTLGKFGSFGVALVASIVYLVHGLKKNFSKSIGLIFTLFVLFMVIDTVDSIMMTPMVFFAMPLMLEMKCDGVGKKKAKLREKAAEN